ncbi:MAG: hypothetical protein QXU32_12990 [Nitrososphaerales archaeon]
MKPTRAKAKRIAIMFFVVGTWGVGISMIFGNNPLILLLSAINLGLGGVFTFYYTKAKK